MEQVRRKLEGDPPTFVDGVVRVTGAARAGGPEPGTYAVEYKAGGGAFKPEQVASCQVVYEPEFRSKGTYA